MVCVVVSWEFVRQTMEVVVDELDVVEEAVEPNRTGQRPLTKASKIVRPSVSCATC